MPGTTRDLLTERADIGGMSIALVDTAGIRETGDVVEQEGVARARGAAAIADLLLVVLDRSRSLDAEDEALLAETRARERIIVLNKADLCQVPPGTGTRYQTRRTRRTTKAAMAVDGCEVSALTGSGLDALAERIAANLGGGRERRDPPRVTNIRHISLLERARDSLTRAVDAVGASKGTIPEEFLLADLQDAASHLQEITGQRSTDDLLRHIFERFCIGK